MEGFVGFLFILGLVGYWIFKAIDAHEQKQKEENLKFTNPEAYVRLKQMEHERELMAHDEKRMRHENVQKGAGIFSEVFRAFWN